MKLAETFLNIAADATIYLETEDPLVKDRLIHELDKSFSLLYALSSEIEAPYTKKYVDFVADNHTQNLIALLESDESCLQGVPDNISKWQNQCLVKLSNTYRYWKENIAQGQLRAYFVVAFNNVGLLSSLRMSSYNPLPYQRIQGSGYDTSIARSLDDARKIIKYYWQAKYKLPTSEVDKNLEAWAVEWGSSLLSQFKNRPVTGQSFSFTFTIFFFISSLRKLCEQGVLEVYHHDSHQKIEPHCLNLPSNMVASGAFIRDQIPDESLTPKQYNNIATKKIAHIQTKLEVISQANSVCHEPFIEYFLIPKDNYFDIETQDEKIVIVPIENLDDLITKFFPNWLIRSKYQTSEQPKSHINIEQFVQQGQQLALQLSKIHRQNKIYKHLTLSCITSTLGSSHVDWIPPTEAMSIALVNPKSTMAYIAPEQTDYYNVNIDQRTDIYSLGVIFYQMLTTKLPFSAENVYEFIVAHVSQKVIPPHDLFPQIPPALSRMIMKMLAKNPDDRYKSVAQIAQLLVAYKNNDTLQVTDAYENLVFPRKMYGRKSEYQQLQKSWQNFLDGNNEIVVVYGMPGIGKTDLVNSLLRDVLEQGCFFFTGKYRQNNKQPSYNAWIEILQKFCRQVLSSSPQNVTKWRNMIMDALGTNVSVVAEVVPDFDNLVGKQEPSSPLPPEESRNRFYFVMEQLFDVIVTNSNKITVFIDDIQWTDDASLLLISRFLGKYPQKLFFIFASRNSETSCQKTAHLQELIAAKGIKIKKIFLSPLSLFAVEKILTHLFSPTPNNIRLLSSFIFQKTMGNPLFVKQLLEVLYREKLLYFEKETRTWSWDLSIIEKLNFSNDILDSLRKKTTSLPKEYQDLLQICSCLRENFSTKMLGGIICKYQDCITDFINEATQQHYIVATQSQWNTLSTEHTYKFTHDLVHQSIHASIDEKTKAQIHYDIGSYYFRQDDLSPSKVAVHWNHCIPQLKNEEKKQLAKFNFQAAIRAKNAASYTKAFMYIQHIQKIAQQIKLETKFMSQVSQQEAELAYLSGNFRQAEKLFMQMIANTKDKVEIAQIHAYLVVLYTHIGDWDQSFKVGKKGLSYLGIHWSSRSVLFTLCKEFFRIKRNLRKLKTTPDYFVNVCKLQDKEQEIALQLLSIFMHTTYYGGKLYAFLTALKMVNITIENGFTVDSPNGYAYFAMLLGHLKTLGSYTLGRDFMEWAITLSQKYNNPLHTGRVYFTFGAVVNHWTREFKLNLHYLQKAKKYSIQGGDLMFASYAAVHPLQVYFFSGKNLQELFEETNIRQDFLEKVSFTSQEFFPIGLQKFIVEMSDVSPSRIRKNLTLNYYRNKQQKIKNTTGIIWLETLELKKLYLQNNYQEAVNVATNSLPYIDGAFGQIMQPEYYYYFTLSLLALYSQEKPRKRLNRRIKKNFAKLTTWKNNCSQNFEHKYLIVKCEILRVQHNFVAAMKLYPQAITIAKQNGFIHQQALANELAAKLYIQLGINDTAKMYMQQSIACYEKWGCTMKVQQLSKLLDSVN
ncbi:ATP-binding protein [Candidatus Uabimicrobium amorphum]|uniref:Serine/threonine protein kinase n=1 Tax=Uabimicrobium amorphum TaxID=2596890 RepID=A0A5S9IJW1_UABAM|nr:AAA family ATPase [Candidatus Uabimicrobium amorphum]BBM82881.1 serine/threonine protein kinase [Candidatus Uabimicrobium amorphum]